MAGASRRVWAWTAALVLGCSASAVAQLTPPPGQVPPAPVKKDSAGQPKIELTKPLVDFGTILDDQAQNAEVMIRNSGTSRLTISGVNTTCGCTVGRVGSTTIDPHVPKAISEVVEPGSEIPLQISFNPTGKVGIVSQRVTLLSDDPANGSVSVEVRAMVEPVVKVEPALVNLGDILRGEMQSHIVTVVGRTPTFSIESMSLTGADFIKPRVLATRDVNKDGKFERHIDIELGVDDTSLPGIVRGILSVRTSDERRRLVTIQVVGQVLGDVALDADRFNLGVVGPGLTYERVLRVKTRSNQPFKILGVEEKTNSETRSDFTITPANTEGTEYHITFQITTSNRSGGLRGGFTIKTDVPEESSIEIVYYGVVSPDYR